MLLLHCSASIQARGAELETYLRRLSKRLGVSYYLVEVRSKAEMVPSFLCFQKSLIGVLSWARYKLWSSVQAQGGVESVTEVTPTSLAATTLLDLPSVN